MKEGEAEFFLKISESFSGPNQFVKQSGPKITDVTNSGNGERGTGNGSLGTNVQRQPASEFKMAVKTKERLEEKQFG